MMLSYQSNVISFFLLPTSTILSLAGRQGVWGLCFFRGRKKRARMHGSATGKRICFGVLFMDYGKQWQHNEVEEEKMRREE